MEGRILLKRRKQRVYWRWLPGSRSNSRDVTKNKEDPPAQVGGIGTGPLRSIGQAPVPGSGVWQW